MLCINITISAWDFLQPVNNATYNYLIATLVDTIEFSVIARPCHDHIFQHIAVSSFVLFLKYIPFLGPIDSHWSR